MKLTFSLGALAQMLHQLGCVVLVKVKEEINGVSYIPTC